MNQYRQEQDIKNVHKIEKFLRELPPFAEQFFSGVQNKFSTLTRLEYARDLIVFFQFLLTLEEFSSVNSTTNFTFHHIEQLNRSHIEQYIKYLTKAKLSPVTQQRKLYSLNSFFAYFFRIEKLAKNIIPLVDAPQSYEKPIIRLEGEEITRILSVDESQLTAGERRYFGITGLRDKIILLFCLSTGVRVSELVGLDIGDLDMKNSSFRITRKGGKVSVLYMSEELAGSMKVYLKSLKERADTTPLFQSTQRKRISVRAVQLLVKKYAVKTVPNKKISPHKLRSTFGTYLYKETRDIYIVAEVLGHSNVNTTKKHYAAISEEIKTDAAKHIKFLQ